MALYHGYGTVLFEYKTIRPNKSMCSGCYCDFYNHGGIAGQTKECWSFAESKVVELYIHESIAKLRDQAVNCELAASIEFENYNDKN